MLRRAAFSVLVFASFAASIPAISEPITFEQFKTLFDKDYGVDEAFRREVFQSNAALIADLNEQSDSAVFSLETPFADLTPEEFKSTILMPSRTPEPFEQDRILPALESPPPASWDWTTKKAVTEVKNQGSMGTCWAFSAVGNMEGQLALKHGNLTSLSVEQLSECDNTDCGPFGGWPSHAYQYVEKANGILTDTELGYCSGIPFGKPGNCEPCMPKGYNMTLCGNHSDLFCNHTRDACGTVVAKSAKALQVTDWKAIGEDETEIAAQLVALGPLSVALNAALLQFYHHGVFNPSSKMCNPKDLDHAVLLVGYGTDKGILSTKDYWLVKNSWGPKWGYFRITRGDGKCGINTLVTSAVIA